jgi:hypothetical protein
MSSRIPYWLAAAVVAAVVASAAATVFRTPRGRMPDSGQAQVLVDARKDREPSAELARLRAEVAGLALQIAALKSASAAPPPTPADAAKIPDEGLDGAEPGGSIEQQRAEEALAWTTHMAGVAAAFDAEMRDAAWARATQSVLDAAIQSDPTIRGAAGALDCRSRSCRLEITEGGRELDKRLPLFLQSIGQTLSDVSADKVADRSGQTKLVLYLTNAPKPEQGGG